MNIKHIKNNNKFFYIRLQERAGNVRRSLRDLDLNEERFYELKGASEEEISLRDYVAVSCMK